MGRKSSPALMLSADPTPPSNYGTGRSNRCRPAPGSRAPGPVSGACFAEPRSPWSPALAPRAPQPVARLCSAASRLLCRSSDFSGSCIGGYGSSPSHHGPRDPIGGHRGICSKTYAKELGAVSSVTEQASDGGAPDIELLGNGGFAQSFTSEVLDFLRLPDDFGRAAVRAAFFAGLSDTGFHSIA